MSSAVIPRRPRLERQMAISSPNSSFEEGFSVHQSHLAPPMIPPDSPRPHIPGATEPKSESYIAVPKEGGGGLSGDKKSPVRLESIILTEKENGEQTQKK